MFTSVEKEYTMYEQIGQGKFGIIHRCISSNNTHHALKTIHKTCLTDSLDRSCLFNEPKILSVVSGHENVLKLFGVYEDEEYLHVVTDLCENGDLFEKINVVGRFMECHAVGIFKQLVSAVAHCHRLGVAHRDIKPDNILFDSRNKLKLADFGSAEWFLCGGEKQPMRGVVGTPYYVAPEVLAGRDYNEKADIWSLGVILYIMLAGVVPFYGETVVETFEAVLRGNLRFPTRIFRSVSPEAKDLLRKMICKDVSRRLSAEQILSKSIPTILIMSCKLSSCIANMRYIVIYSLYLFGLLTKWIAD